MHVQVGALPIAGAGMPASCPAVLLSTQRQRVADLTQEANRLLAARQSTDAAQSTFATTCTCRRRGAAEPRVAAVVQVSCSSPIYEPPFFVPWSILPNNPTVIFTPGSKFDGEI